MISNRSIAWHCGSLLLALGLLAAPLFPGVGGTGGQQALAGGSAQSQPLIRYQFSPIKQFGLEAQTEKGWRRLTFSASGTTNVVLLKIGERSVVFGDNESAGKSARWLVKAAQLKPERARGRIAGWECIWADGDLKVTQRLEILQAASAKRADVCLVTYILENTAAKDSPPRKELQVGLRVLLDTLVGDNDAPAFRPLARGFPILDKAEFIGRAKIPTFVQLLEVADPKNPGLVAYLSLHTEEPTKTPDRFVITRMPKKDNDWNYELQDMLNDAAVLMYWDQRPLRPHEPRVLGYAYGLRPYLPVNSKTAK